MPSPSRHSSSSKASGAAGRSSSHSSRSGKPLSQLNAGSGLSASALLAASAQASEALDRLLRGEDASYTRPPRSRSRTRSPHKVVLAEITGAVDTRDHPFLVHTVTASPEEEAREERHRRERRRSKSKSHHHKSSSKSSSSKREKEVDRFDDDVSVASSALSSQKPSRSSTHASSTHVRSSKDKSDHRHRSKSRSLSRTRENGVERSSSASRHRHRSSTHTVSSSSSSRPRHAPSSSSSSFTRRREQERTRDRHELDYHSRTSPHSHSHSHSQQHRSRSRSHSRNRYPDGLAPPLQAVGGGPDHELRSKFVETFESERRETTNGGVNGHHVRHRSRTPVGGENRFDERAAYELERLALRDSAEHHYQHHRRHHSRDDHGHEVYPRRDYGFESGPLGPGDDLESEAPFDLEGSLIPEPPLAGPDSAQALAGTVLLCGLCRGRYEEPSSVSGDANGSVVGSGGKTPRFLLCGHTFCTSCLSTRLEAQQELDLASRDGVATTLGASAVKVEMLACPCGTCASTPLGPHGVMGLSINTAFLDASRFLRSRRAAGHGLADTGVGRGDERGETEKLAELNAELEADARLQTNLSATYSLPTSLPCQQCATRIAALFCQACNVRFCAPCSAGTHVGRALADHVKRGLVLPINVARARGLLVSVAGTGVGSVGGASHGHQGVTGGGVLMCPTHSDQALSLYCHTCRLPVCRDCVTPLFHGAHLPPGHDVARLEVVLATTTSELKTAVQSVESSITRLEHGVTAAARRVDEVARRSDDVRSELRDAFALVRSAVLKALNERETLLEQELGRHARSKFDHLTSERQHLAQALVSAQAAREQGVRVLASPGADGSADIFAIKALLDVRAAIAHASTQKMPSPPPPSDAGAQPNDVLLRVRPRELIRLVEAQIARQGGVIASVPSSPAFISFASSGTSMVLAWAPASPASSTPENETIEYRLEVCELPRDWRAKMRALRPNLVQGAVAPHHQEENDKARTLVNWLSIPPGSINIDAPELAWKEPTGPDWVGTFGQWWMRRGCARVCAEGAPDLVDFEPSSTSILLFSHLVSTPPAVFLSSFFSTPSAPLLRRGSVGEARQPQRPLGLPLPSDGQERPRLESAHLLHAVHAA